MFRLRIFLTALSILGCLATTARAAEDVGLRTAFSPDKLGEPTTITFEFVIHSTMRGQVPSPLLNVDLRLPKGMNPATATLGDAQCTTVILRDYGPDRCPPNSFLGRGSALAEVSIAATLLRERATVTILNGPPENQHIVMLVYAEGNTPVSAEQVYHATLLLDPGGMFGGSIDTVIPPLQVVAEGPFVSVVRFRASLGPQGITYYRHVGDKRVAFHPEGIAIPTRCPKHGFLFSGTFTFMDGTTVTTSSAVPCPSRGHRGAHRHG